MNELGYKHFGACLAYVSLLTSFYPLPGLTRLRLSRTHSLIPQPAGLMLCMYSLRKHFKKMNSKRLSVATLLVVFSVVVLFFGSVILLLRPTLREKLLRLPNSQKNSRWFVDCKDLFFAYHLADAVVSSSVDSRDVKVQVCANPNIFRCFGVQGTLIDGWLDTIRTIESASLRSTNPTRDVHPLFSLPVVLSLQPSAVSPMFTAEPYTSLSSVRARLVSRPCSDRTRFELGRVVVHKYASISDPNCPLPHMHMTGEPVRLTADVLSQLDPFCDYHVVVEVDKAQAFTDNVTFNRTFSGTASITVPASSSEMTASELLTDAFAVDSPFAVLNSYLAKSFIALSVHLTQQADAAILSQYGNLFAFQWPSVCSAVPVR